MSIVTDAQVTVNDLPLFSVNWNAVPREVAQMHADLDALLARGETPVTSALPVDDYAEEPGQGEAQPW